jgi:deoxyadenosine/deoxycytidine kinase
MLIIEGVVGVGKTSLMHYMVKEGFVSFSEPVLDNPILDKFYHDRQRYAFATQIYFLSKRFENLQIASQIPNAIMDRSIYGDAIFADMHRENKTMEEVEYEIYHELHSTILNNIMAPTLVVYLQVGVDVAIQRIQKRGRDYEQKVERPYWEKLNEKYDAYFSHYTLSPILTINVDHLDFEASVDDRVYIIMRIKEALEALKS